MEDVLIIGAGLSGLSAAYYLKKKGINAFVVEARERCGGRILTKHASGNSSPVEMGATWFTDKHTSYIGLLEELKVPFFKQYQKGKAVVELYPDPPQLFEMPEGEEASYRVAGGTSSLIKALTAFVGEDRISLNTPISSVVEQEGHIALSSTKGETFTCKNLIFTLPPNLIRAQQISFTPELPAALSNLMENTHTWMGDSIKFALEYSTPFWRKKGYAGTLWCPTGIAPEVYDHCNKEETHFALKGFLSADAAALPEEERKALVVEHIRKFLGPEAGNYLSYTEKIWAREKYTYAPPLQPLLPHQHQGHPFYAQALMNGRLYLAGTETSARFGGYMEGAVHSGFTTAEKILSTKR